jgi:cell division protein FtsB
MMRSPYQSPSDPAPRYLRVTPRDRRKRLQLVIAGVVVVGGYLAWSFIGTDSGLLRIHALRQENEGLERRKTELAVRAEQAERERKAAAKDPLLEERVARERFHLVKKDEMVYFYRDPVQGRRDPGAEGADPAAPADPAPPSTPQQDSPSPTR